MNTDTNVTPDVKIISKIQKLLNLGRDGGATEAEAATAIEMAEAIMLANNLSMAQIEISGGAAEQRLKEETKGKANYRWQRWLMTAIAEANFCHLDTIIGKRKIRYGYRDIALGYNLIGRVSNVTATQNMYDYLLQTCARLRTEFEGQPGRYKDDGALFVEGLANRLSERVTEHHEKLMREQALEAERQKKEQAARASHPAYAGNVGNALVVVMEDFAQTERELNADMNAGLAPGTTTAKRLEREAREAERERQITALVAAGVVWDVAWYMVRMEWTQEKAQAYHDEQMKKEADPKKDRHRSRGGWGRTREESLKDRLYTGAAQEGRRKAEGVSLSKQVDGKGGSNKRLN